MKKKNKKRIEKKDLDISNSSRSAAGAECVSSIQIKQQTKFNFFSSSQAMRILWKRGREREKWRSNWWPSCERCKGKTISAAREMNYFQLVRACTAYQRRWRWNIYPIQIDDDADDNDDKTKTRKMKQKIKIFNEFRIITNYVLIVNSFVSVALVCAPNSRSNEAEWYWIGEQVNQCCGDDQYNISIIYIKASFHIIQSFFSKPSHQSTHTHTHVRARARNPIESSSFLRFLFKWTNSVRNVSFRFIFFRGIYCFRIEYAVWCV